MSGVWTNEKPIHGQAKHHVTRCGQLKGPDWQRTEYITAYCCSNSTVQMAGRAGTGYIRSSADPLCILQNPCLQHCKVSTILHLLLYLSLLSLLPLLLYSSQPFTPPAACYTPVQPKASLAHPDLTLPYPPYPTLTYPTIHQTQPQQNLGLRTILYLRENNPHQRHTCN